MDHIGCNHTHCTAANQSVCQTISEMDWERGIWNAAFNGEKDKIITLIDKAKNAKEFVNMPDNSGYTALHYAARNGHIDICKTLIQVGANVNAQTSGLATPLHKAAAAVTTSPIRAASEIQAFRNVVLKDIIDSEKAHVAEMQGLSKECATKTGPDQRVGGLFLQWAPKIKSVHQTYCAGHPKAVCILDKYKEDLNSWMENAGAVCPGVLVLTAGLSKPFRRLSKYPAMLQELARHVHEAHPDRGDTHRASVVYKDIASGCAALRRQKELELQVVTGEVRGWPGGELAALGDVLHMGSVAVGPSHQDRYLVLFPSALLLLSVSKRVSAFVYEGCLPLTGITVCKLDDTETRKNAFEISGPMIDTIVAVCQTRAEADNWVSLLQKHSNTSSPVHEPGQPQSLPHMAMTDGNNPDLSSGLTSHKRSHSFNNHQSYSQHTQQTQRTWSITCLRPAPPLRPQSFSVGSDENIGPTHPYAPHQRKSNSYEEDALILKVIEAYCTSARCRNAVSSECDDEAPLSIEALVRSPSLPIHSNAIHGSPSLWTIVMRLQNEIKTLKLDVKSLQLQLNEEKQERNLAIAALHTNNILKDLEFEYRIYNSESLLVADTDSNSLI
ncbi:hypothetical protein MSG28_002232, partial [Choristoneura fumiferana]